DPTGGFFRATQARAHMPLARVDIPKPRLGDATLRRGRQEIVRAPFALPLKRALALAHEHLAAIVLLARIPVLLEHRTRLRIPAGRREKLLRDLDELEIVLRDDGALHVTASS